MQLGAPGAGDKGQRAVGHAGLDVFVVGVERAGDSHRARAAHPVGRRAGRADFFAIQVLQPGEREFGPNVVAVQRHAAQVNQVAFGPGVGHGGNGFLQIGHGARHQIHALGAKGRVVGDVLQRELGRLKHGADNAQVGHAIGNAFGLATQLDQGATKGLGPLDLELATGGQALVHLGNKGFVQGLDPQKARRVAGGGGQLDDLLRLRGRSQRQAHGQHREGVRKSASFHGGVSLDECGCGLGRMVKLERTAKLQAPAQRPCPHK